MYSNNNNNKKSTTAYVSYMERQPDQKYIGDIYPLYYLLHSILYIVFFFSAFAGHLNAKNQSIKE